MSILSASELLELALAFELSGHPVQVAPQPGGHIHHSWVVTSAGGSRYLLQRLNTDVFPEPGAVMSNVVRVIDHLQAAGEPTIALVPTRDGTSWWRGSGGDVWRAFVFLEDAVSPSPVSSPAGAGAVGNAFGRFAGALASLPAPPLAVTIPRFHDLRHRWAQLERVASRSAALGLEHFDYLIERWESAVAALPRRIAHNDAKADNVLLDRRTRALRAVIDLDTVMSGTILPDLGDLVRGGACPAAEDETDLSLVRVDDQLFAALVAGYAAGAAGRVGPQELSCVLLAAQCITFEQAVRFLTDHLSGDRYYRVARRGHNLDRAHNQLALLDDLVRREDHLTALAAGVSERD